MTHKQKVDLIDHLFKKISLKRQAFLLGISRSGLYYHKKENATDKNLMEKIDFLYTETPFYGSRRIQWALFDRYGIHIGRGHVQRLMHLMGIAALYPKPKTSIPRKDHAIYPYLLRGITAQKPNHIWGTDLTYIRLKGTWAYLVALIDWYSRFVLAWKLSLSMDADFCCDALAAALTIATPLIHNSDQGAQFTDNTYLALLKKHRIQISMDGRGRCMDNIFTERFWRTIKQENVYLMNYATITEARRGLTHYFSFYNNQRRHQSLGYRTPYDVYSSNTLPM